MMPEANPASALQQWFHEMIAQKKQGMRAGTGGNADGSLLWMYYSQGDAMESRIVFRAAIQDGKPIVTVDRYQGDTFSLLAKMSPEG
jgi:hypothetical protein